METVLLAGPTARGQGVMVSSLDGRFILDVRKKIFTTSKTRPQVIQRQVDASFLETFEVKLERALSNLIQMKMSLLTAGL